MSGPKIRLDVAQLVRPGEVLLSEKERGSGEAARSRVNSVSVKEIEDLLARLRPLALRNDERVAWLRAKKEPAKEARESIEKLDAESDKEDQMSSIHDDPEAEDEAEERPPPEDSGDKQTAQARDEYFLAKSLADLGSQLSASAQVADRPRLRVARPSAEHWQSGGRTAALGPPAMERARRHEARAVIPIEILVDHLMSGSRIATRGSHHHGTEDHDHDHAGQASGDQVAVGEDDDGEDEEDEDDPYGAASTYNLMSMNNDDSDDDGDDDENASGLDVQESMRRETVVGRPLKSVNFDMMANRTDSWVPLGALGGGLSRSGAAVKTEARGIKRETDQKNEASSQGGIVLGGKQLSRKELIELIRMLNRFASKKEPSKERDASRKLLRFLIKKALNNYRKSQVQVERKNRERSSRIKDGGVEDDRIRDSLRSLLVEPQVSTGIGAKGDQKPVDKISIQLQPWRPKSILFGKDQAEDEEMEAQKAGPEAGTRPTASSKKSLAQISDDLERYFDTDFFEDLADDNKQLKNETTAQAESPIVDIPPSVAPKESKPRAHQISREDLEKADEEDADLDYVPPRSLKSRELKRRRGDDRTEAKKRNNKRRKRRKRRKAKGDSVDRQAAGSSHRKRNKLKQSDNDQDEDDGVEDHEDDREDDDTSRRGRKRSHQKKRTPRRRKRKRQRTKKAPVAEAESSEPSELPGGDRSTKHDEEPERKVEVEHEEETEEAKKDEADGGAVKTKEKENKQGTKNKSRRRRRPKEVQRNEIPAPILAERVLQVNSSNSRTPPVKKARIETIGGKSEKKQQDKKERAKEKKIDSRKADKKMTKEKKEPPKMDGAKSSSKTRRESSREIVSREPEMNREDDAKDGRDQPDYDQDEGTRYTEVCEGDGKCTVTMESSDPRLARAIDSNGTTLVNQLDRWINPEEDLSRRIDITDTTMPETLANRTSMDSESVRGEA